MRTRQSIARTALRHGLDLAAAVTVVISVAVAPPAAQQPPPTPTKEDLTGFRPEGHQDPDQWPRPQRSRRSTRVLQEGDRCAARDYGAGCRDGGRRRQERLPLRARLA